MGDDDDGHEWTVVPVRPTRITVRTRGQDRSSYGSGPVMREPDSLEGSSRTKELGRSGGSSRMKEPDRSGGSSRTSRSLMSSFERTPQDQPRSANFRQDLRTVARSEREDTKPIQIHQESKGLVRMKPKATEISEEDLKSKIGAPIRLKSERGRDWVTRSPRPGRKGREEDSNHTLVLKESDGEMVAGRKERKRGLLRLPKEETLLNKQERDEAGGEKPKAVKKEFSLGGHDDWPTILSPQTTSLVRESGSEALWSKVVKMQPPPLKRKVAQNDNEDLKSDGGASGKEGEDEGEFTAVGGKKKRKRKKKKSGGTKQPPPLKEERLPLTLDLGPMLDALESSKASHTVAVAGSAPIVKQAAKQTHTKTRAADTTPRNILDSSAPAVRRGKERETPKKKKPSALRKVITKEKEEKKRLREQGLSIPLDLDVSKEPGSETDYSCHSDHDSTPGLSPIPPIHSRKFREYCTHMVSEEINDCVQLLLTDLVRFQDRQYHKDPIKAKARRRYVCGLREVNKHLKLKRLKCVIIPPNLEKIQSTGGINDIVQGIVTQCHELGVRLVFAMSRRRLAYVLKKKHKVGCCGIFSYDGAETHYKKLVQLIEDATEKYEKAVHDFQSGETHAEGPDKGGGAEGEGLSQGSSSGAETYYSNKYESSFGDSDGEVDLVNGNETKPLAKTPWSIFFPSDSGAHESTKDSSCGVLQAKASHMTDSQAGVDHRTVSRSHWEATTDSGSPYDGSSGYMTARSNAIPTSVTTQRAAHSSMPLHLIGQFSLQEGVACGMTVQDLETPAMVPVPSVLAMPTFQPGGNAAVPTAGTGAGQDSTNIHGNVQVKFRLNVNAAEFVPSSIGSQASNR